jgi:hypothetical protein
VAKKNYFGPVAQRFKVLGLNEMLSHKHLRTEETMEQTVRISHMFLQKLDYAPFTKKGT